MSSLHTSTVDITLQHRHLLTCQCRKPDGTWCSSTLDLNDCLGNNNGKFIWGRTSFAESASQIHLSLEGNEGIPFLHAQLNDRHGSQQSASINLMERIRNENGQLSYLEY
ncbi:hypothetical protein MAP00_003095 [Monascus purpureus]|nr:hypothetical protein MAP00_003095 [Monascus purpureus]